jgi:hypothetical protein
MDEIQYTFKYEPLTHPDSIRLLVLQPGPPGRKIHGSLIHTTVSECQYDIHFPYTALSYVWGNPNETAEITIDGQPFVVTANLASALDSLRDERIAIRVWADAACIDQKNIPERNQQVGLMREVYSFAQQTIVYLGEADNESREVFDVMRRHKLAPDELTVSDLFRESAIAQILSRPWFTRVWIYQELVLSKEVWVQLGRDRMLWDDFCVALLSPDDRETYIWKASRHVYASLRMLAKMRGARSSFWMSQLTRAERPASLLSLLESRRGLQVVDPRDMVYGHLAVAGLHRGSNVNDNEGHGLALLVDYNKSVAEVYIDATSYIVETGDGNCILPQVEMLHGNPRMEGLPSWVPDWTQGIDGNMASIPPITSIPGPVGGSVTPSRVCILEPSILACRGLRLVRIKETSEVLSSSEEDYEKWFEIEALDNSDSNPRFPSKKLLSKMYQEWKQYLHNNLDTPSDREPYTFEIDNIWEDFKSSTDFPFRIDSFLELFVRHMFHINAPSILHGRKIALLLHGARQAVVPAASQIGDMIYVLSTIKGVHTVVLRPCANDGFGEADEEALRQKMSIESEEKICVEHFTFIGTAWVDGSSQNLLDHQIRNSLQHLQHIIALH